uniref:Uncharacterized protein n=1 Tax=Rhizophora mucronata TaxID=61149 RepID=A0A2P2N1Q1_RHIMU
MCNKKKTHIFVVSHMSIKLLDRSFTVNFQLRCYTNPIESI